MKILHTEASLGWGGQEIRIFRESMGMKKKGHDVIIAACPDSMLLKNSKEAGLEVMPVNFRRRDLLSIIPFLKKYIENLSIDIVNTHSSKDSWLALPAARLARNKPLVIRTRHLSTPIARNLLNRFLYGKLPHIIFTTSRSIKQEMVLKNKISPEKIIPVPTGADTELFDPSRPHRDIRTELGLRPGTPLAGSVSVLRSWKGLDFFAEAASLVVREIPEARFVITGEGPYRAKLEETIRKTNSGNIIYLLGHRDDIPDIIHSLNVFVHPSYANEGVPQAVLQAMSMKKPVVVSGLDSLKEIVIHGETGIVVPPRDPASLAREITELFRNSTLARSLGDNARKTAVDNYSFEGMINKTESIYMGYFKNRNQQEDPCTDKGECR